jgi:endoglucanase
MVKLLGAGINIGNTFDAHGFDWLSSPSVTDMEVAWQRGETDRVITENYIKAIAKAGFKSVRLCVTWYKAADPETFEISSEWFDRIEEVVKWCISNKLYVILNSHHDESRFTLFDDNIATGAYPIKRYWEQIAVRFNSYGEQLLFEGLNEPRSKGSDFEWAGGTEEEQRNLNFFNQVFVDTVRHSGGNNKERMLVVPTYAASSRGFANFQIPNDTAENGIIISVHSYVPNVFCLGTHDNITGTTAKWDESDSASVDEILFTLKRVAKYAKKLGVPVIIGEWGSRNKKNTEVRARHAKFYVETAKKLGIPTFWWDDGMVESEDTPTEYMGLFDKITCKNKFTKITKAIVTAEKNTEVEEVIDEETETTEGVAVQLMAREAIDWKTELVPMKSDVLRISEDGEYILTVQVQGYERLAGLAIQSEHGHFEDPNIFENSVKAAKEWDDTKITVLSVKADGEELLTTPYTNDLIGHDYEPIEGFAYVPIWNAWMKDDQRLQKVAKITQPGSQISGKDFARKDKKPMNEIVVTFKIHTSEEG